MPIVFLRHPILRAKSVYEFVKKDNTQLNHKIASNGSFGEYVDMALSGGSGGLVIKNYQVIHLSDASFRHDPILKAGAQPHDLNQAEKLLFSWPIFGIVEAYEKSLELYQTLYSRRILGLQLPVTWRNKTTQSKSKISIDAQLEAIREELGNETFDALTQANDLDLRLYRSCAKGFEDNVNRYLR